jgi:hypothetical protein
VPGGVGGVQGTAPPAAPTPHSSPAPSSLGAPPSAPATGFGTELPTPAQALPNLRAALIDASLVLIFLGFVTFPAQVFNRTYLANQAEIDAWWERRLAVLRRLSGRRAPALVQYLAVVVAGSLLGALVNPSTRFVGAALGLAFAIFVSIGLRVIVGGLAESGWRGTTPKLVSVPTGLIVTAVCVVASRALGLRPGFLYGVVIDLRFPRESADREGRAKAVQMVAVLGLSLVSWVLWVPVASAAAVHGSGAPLRLLRDILAVTVVSGLLGLMFNLVPLRFMHGDVIRRWSLARWAALYATVAFFFTAILLRPEHGPSRTGVTLVSALVLFGLFGVFSFGFWARFSRR